MSTSIAENLARVREQIQQAARRAGRNPEQVRLVAVSKTFPPEYIVTAVQQGAQDIAENRVEEAGEKILRVDEVVGKGKIRWHLIGHLQRRKARDAVAWFDMIQSVDTLRLAESLNRHAREQAKIVPVLLQINVGDPHKFGFTLEPRNELFQNIEKIVALSNVRVDGLMTIGPLVATAEQGRPYFRELRRLRDELAARFSEAPWRELSMGMTDDYAVAIEEGATIVRIGRAIFGQRASEER